MSLSSGMLNYLIIVAVKAAVGITTSVTVTYPVQKFHVNLWIFLQSKDHNISKTVRSVQQKQTFILALKMKAIAQANRRQKWNLSAP